MIEIIPNWHPFFVNFSIALLSVSVLFFVLEKTVHETIMGDNFLIFARYSLWLGTIFSIFTVAAGWSAFNSVDHDELSHTAMILHRNWALATFALFVVGSIWLAASSRLKEEPSLIFILYLVIGVGLLSVTGYKGTELVYKHGLGVQSLPNKSGHRHDHNHAHSHSESPRMQMDDESVNDLQMDDMLLEQTETATPIVEEAPVELEEDGITRQKLGP